MARVRVTKRKYSIPQRSRLTEVLSFNLSPEMREELGRIADDNNCSIGYALRFAIRLLSNRCKRLHDNTIEEEIEEDLE